MILVCIYVYYGPISLYGQNYFGAYDSKNKSGIELEIFVLDIQ